MTNLPGASMGDLTHDKVMCRRPDRQGGSGLEGLHGPAHLPQNQSLSVYCLLYYAFNNSSDINKGLPPTTFL